MHVHKPNNSKAMAALFGMKAEWFAGAMLCMIGISYGELHDLWAKREYLRLKAEHPDWDDETLAPPHLGYSDHASLWNFLNRTHLLSRRPRRHAPLPTPDEIRASYLAKLNA